MITITLQLASITSDPVARRVVVPTIYVQLPAVRQRFITILTSCYFTVVNNNITPVELYVLTHRLFYQNTIGHVYYIIYDEKKIAKSKAPRIIIIVRYAQYYRPYTRTFIYTRIRMTTSDIAEDDR